MDWIMENFWTYMLLIIGCSGCGGILLLASVVGLVVYVTKRE